MNKLIFLLIMCHVVWAHDAPKKGAADHHEFTISNFQTEGGVTLPMVRMSYGTYGHLNPAKDNGVLLPSHYMADYHGYEWLIGPGHALDTSQLFLITTELFGNGHSSSPSNTPEPFHGPRFPQMTIRDNAEAAHRLLTEELKITHVRAIIGFSVGAQQAFQWAVSYPAFADRIVKPHSASVRSTLRAQPIPMPSHRYRVVDVFTKTPLEGNPLAVFPDGSNINDATMQKIAKELNLSETVFLLPPTNPSAAAKLRIFTPSYEMDFAGHPTIGASFVILQEGIVPRDSERFAVEENVGLVPIRVEAGDRPPIWLTTPPIQYQQTFDRALCARVLGLQIDDLLPPTPQLLTAGNPTIFIALKNKEAVDRAWLDRSGAIELRAKDLRPLCVFIFTPTAEGAYSRMFAPEHGVVEDPATGSSTGPLAAYMMRTGLISSPTFASEQGTKMGRRSLLHVEIRGTDGSDGIDVGGYVTPLVEASMTL